MATATLYELSEKYQRLWEMANDEEFDHSVGLSSEFVQVLESIEDQLSDKLEGCCRAYRSMCAMRDALDQEVKLLKLRSERLDRSAIELKDYMQHSLEQMQIQKTTAGIFRLSVCNNSQPSVTVLDLEQVPHKFDKPQERQVSLSAIRDAVLKHGEDVPGVDITRGKHLRIS